MSAPRLPAGAEPAGSGTAPGHRQLTASRASRRLLAVGVVLALATPVGLAAGAQRGTAALALLALALAGWLCAALIEAE